MLATDITEKQKESLILLMEEAGEVIQAASKILRYGPESEFANTSNIMALAREIADVVLLAEITADNFGISVALLEDFTHIKDQKLKQYSGLYDDQESN